MVLKAREQGRTLFPLLLLLLVLLLLLLLVVVAQPSLGESLGDGEWQTSD